MTAGLRRVHSGACLDGVLRAELNLSQASRMVRIDHASLRKILYTTDAPPDLLRRSERPRWRLDSHRLIRHLEAVRPRLAARLIERLRA